MARQSLRDALGEAGVTKLLSRDIDRHRQRLAVGRHQITRRREGRVHHPRADGADQAVLLRQRDEATRPDGAELGVVPAHQHLDADGLATGEVELGLEGEIQLFEMLAQVTGQAIVVEVLHVCTGREHMQGAADIDVIVFPVQHGEFGQMHQAMGTPRVLRRQTDADPRRDRQGLAIQSHQHHQPFAQLVGTRDQAGLIPDEEQREGIAQRAADQGVAILQGHGFCHPLQQRIDAFGTVRRVDDFQVGQRQVDDAAIDAAVDAFFQQQFIDLGIEAIARQQVDGLQAAQGDQDLVIHPGRTGLRQPRERRLEADSPLADRLETRPLGAEQLLPATGVGHQTLGIEDRHAPRQIGLLHQQPFSQLAGDAHQPEAGLAADATRLRLLGQRGWQLRHPVFLSSARRRPGELAEAVMNPQRLFDGRQQFDQDIERHAHSTCSHKENGLMPRKGRLSPVMLAVGWRNAGNTAGT